MIKSSKKKVLDRRAKPVLVPMDTSQFALPKPAKKVKETRVTRSGRKIESPKDYQMTKQLMWQRQKGMCAHIGCFAVMPTPAYGHRHHPEGRGLGGGRRDDNNTVLWCIECHRQFHQ